MINVSVVIPVFSGQTSYLAQCLDSVINQSLSNIQVILLTKESENFVSKVISDFSKNFPNIEVMSNFNLNKVMGKYVLFLSSEDYLNERMMERLFEKAEANQSDIVYCDYFNDLSMFGKTSSDSFQKEDIPLNYSFSFKDSLPNFFHLFPCVSGCFLYNKKFLDQNFELLSGCDCKDLSFWAKSLILSNKITYLNVKLVNHHLYKKIAPQNIQLLKQFDDVLSFLQDHQLSQFEGSFVSKWLNLLDEKREELLEPEKSLFDIQIVKKTLLSLLNKNGNRIVHPLASILREKNLSDSFEKVLEGTKEKVIPIVIPVNNLPSDVYGASVTIQSILENVNTDYFYDIYILHTSNLKEGIKTRLEKLTQKEIRVTCINIEKQILQDTCRETNELFSTHLFVLSDIFSYKKVLYLKPQVIVQKDFSDLFNLDMSKYVLAGCLVHGDINYVEESLGLVYEKFINTDVMLINLDLWKKGDYTQSCLDTFLVPLFQYRVPIRDILNTVFQKYICVLDEKYNGQYRLVFGKKYDKEDYYNSEFYTIINYDSQKPWDEPEEDGMEIWWDYARKSSFYELILFRNVSRKELIEVENKAPENGTILKEETPLLKNISKIPFQNQTMSLLLKNYVQEFLKYCFSWGKNKKVHKENLQKITQEIHKLST